LGEGRALADILAGRRGVTEGVATASSIVELAARHDIDMPIARAIDQIVNQGADIDATIAGVLARPFRAELPRD
jgi:glycerol-3-phosphate dehydrogenase (NAD(P)+)